MKMVFDKKGVSPIVTTAILIAIVIILAIIIILWARGFIGEVVTKIINDNEKRAEDFCKEVEMRGFVNNDIEESFGFENSGNVPIYAYRLKLDSGGSSDVVVIDSESGGSVNPGGTVIIDGYTYSDYESIKIIPILLGTVEGVNQEFECPESDGIEV